MAQLCEEKKGEGGLTKEEEGLTISEGREIQRAEERGRVRKRVWERERVMRRGREEDGRIGG